MPVNLSTRTSSHTKPVELHEEAERLDDTLKNTTNLTFTTISQHKHQRITTLRFGARQVEENGSISGQTPPYLPKPPSLFRDSIDDPTVQTTYHTSPLRQVSHSLRPRLKSTSLPAWYIPTPHSKPFKMPHAVSIANTGFQALILCGPGVGLGTFTNRPDESPKALLPIANRPMLWYALDLCYRMGITDISIITPPEAKVPIEAALAQNPDLTSLPVPKPDLLAPKDLGFNTPTAELLRLPEVQSVIKQDFVVLPCDVVCNFSAEAFFELYLTSMAGIAGLGTDFDADVGRKAKSSFNLGAEASGRRGGLSIWYNTANREESVKKEECDFMGTTSIDSFNKAPISKIPNLPEGRLQKLVTTAPMSTMMEQTGDLRENPWKLRQSLLRKYGSVKCMTKYRDSHIYFFPRWIKDFALQNEEIEGISEDLIGTWVNSEWRKPSYRQDHGAQRIFRRERSASMSGGAQSSLDQSIEDEIDILSLSSTQIRHQPNATQLHKEKPLHLASRVQPINPEDSMISTTTDDSQDDEQNENELSVPYFPPMLSYILSSRPDAPLLRRVDTTPILLSVSLLLAKLPTLDEPNPSPLSFANKIHPTSQPPADVRVTVNKTNTLIAPNVTLTGRCNIKEACVGSGCTIGWEVKIERCVIMDGADIGEKSILKGCVIGKKAHIGKGCELENCEVQDGYVIPDGMIAKNKIHQLGGMDDEDDDMMMAEA